MPKTIYAIVVGADLNGLGTVRSLARGGVRTAIVDTSRRRPGMRSWLCRKFLFDALEGRRLVDGLIQIRKKFAERPVLILTAPAAVKTVSEHREELARAYRFHLPPPHIVGTLQHEARFHEFAVQHDLPVPRSIIVRRDTALAALETLSFPAIIKTSERFSDPSGAARVHYVTTPRDAEALCHALLQTDDELLVQEWIEGPDSNVCFSLFHLGHRPENFTVFVGRKLACSPRQVGNTALCLAAPELTEALEPVIAKYLDLTEFQGPGSLEFKWDMRQRRYVIIGRSVGQTDQHAEIAPLSGVNLPLALYRDEADLPPLAAGPVDGAVAWRESALARSLPALSRDIRVYDGYWRLSDPVPGLTHYAGAIGEEIYRRILQPLLASEVAQRLPSALAAKLRSVRKPMFGRNRPSTR